MNLEAPVCQLVEQQNLKFCGWWFESTQEYKCEECMKW